jgi:hypothetical protein
LVTLARFSALPHQVYAFGKPRSNPNAKDSQWVRDRAELESQKPGVPQIMLARMFWLFETYSPLLE